MKSMVWCEYAYETLMNAYAYAYENFLTTAPPLPPRPFLPQFTIMPLEAVESLLCYSCIVTSTAAPSHLLLYTYCYRPKRCCYYYKSELKTVFQLQLVCFHRIELRGISGRRCSNKPFSWGLYFPFPRMRKIVFEPYRLCAGPPASVRGIPSGQLSRGCGEPESGSFSEENLGIVKCEFSTPLEDWKYFFKELLICTCSSFQGDLDSKVRALMPVNFYVFIFLRMRTGWSVLFVFSTLFMCAEST